MKRGPRANFTRADIEAHFRSAFERYLADGEKIIVGDIKRLKGVSPACWVVDYTKESKTAHSLHLFHSQVIIVVYRNYSGSTELRFAETVILPEEQKEPQA